MNSHGWWRWRWPLTYQNRWRGWPLPGSWPCQSALCPDRNAGISAAPASLCGWCGRHSVEENAHKQTNTTTDKLMACEGFDSLSQHKPNKLTRHFRISRARGVRGLEDSVQRPGESAANYQTSCTPFSCCALLFCGAPNGNLEAQHPPVSPVEA